MRLVKSPFVALGMVPVLLFGQYSILIPPLLASDFGGMQLLIQDSGGTPVFTQTCVSLVTGDIEVASGCAGGENVILLDGIPVGTYTLRISNTPAGYEVVSAPDVEITAGQLATPTMTLGLIAVEPQTGGLTLQLLESTGASLPTGTCVSLMSGEMPLAEGCDHGQSVITYVDVPAGTYWLRVESLPAGYSLVSAPDATIVGGATSNGSVTLAAPVAEPQTGGISVQLLESSGSPLPIGTCLTLMSSDGALMEGCDPGTAVISFSDLLAGTYSLRVESLPTGYTLVSAPDVTIIAGEASNGSVTLAAPVPPTAVPTPPPTPIPTVIPSPTPQPTVAPSPTPAPTVAPSPTPIPPTPTVMPPTPTQAPTMPPTVVPTTIPSPMPTVPSAPTVQVQALVVQPSPTPSIAPTPVPQQPTFDSILTTFSPVLRDTDSSMTSKMWNIGDYSAEDFLRLQQEAAILSMMVSLAATAQKATADAIKGVIQKP